jgi:hypothetical protein
MYLLGTIEPAHQAVVARHLAARPRCRTELAGLAGLPAPLRRVPPMSCGGYCKVMSFPRCRGRR